MNDQLIMVKIVEEGFESEKVRILAQVEDGIESAKRSLITKIKSYFKDGNHKSAGSNMKLEFRKGIAPTILTGEEIKGEGGVPIEVVLVDVSAGDVVVAGAEASADVEIVLLKGIAEEDEEFNANIIPEVEGKQPILAGKVTLQLKRGIGVVENIKFRHHAGKIKPSQFKLGARVVGNRRFRIKEAKTEPFILKDFRTKYYEKHENPSLSDKVSRLVCIGRGGKIEKRLEDKEIYTVEDFLIQLLINPQGLKSIVKSQAKKWEAIVNNARACLSSKRVYFYMDLEQRTGISFNILGHVLGLYRGCYYSRTSTLSEELEKKKLLASAYQNWEEVKAFNDVEFTLLQHVSCSGEAVRGSTSGCMNTSSTMNLFHEFESFMSNVNSTGDNDIDVIYDAAMQLHHAWPCSPIDFDQQQIYGSSMDLNGVEAQVISESNAIKKRKAGCI